MNLAARKAFGTAPYLLLQKNGKEVGQSVPHLHFHYIPRKAGDSSIFLFIVKMWLSDIKKPLSSSEMQQAVRTMKKAMSSLQEEELSSDAEKLGSLGAKMQRAQP